MTHLAEHPAARLSAVDSRTLPDRLDSALAALFERVGLWRERVRSRRELLRLNDRALRDIGIDPAIARAQAELPFWRADPRRW